MSSLDSIFKFAVSSEMKSLTVNGKIRYPLLTAFIPPNALITAAVVLRRDVAFDYLKIGMIPLVE